MHAEATSEKLAMGHFLDGRVSAVIGTHTHVQTSDARILPKGTACLTDAGMTGPSDSILGMRKDIILTRFLTQLPQKFEVGKGEPVMEGAALEIEARTGKARAIKTFRYGG
jgi:calcineurin-like phosphoesterase